MVKTPNAREKSPNSPLIYTNTPPKIPARVSTNVHDRPKINYSSNQSIRCIIKGEKGIQWEEILTLKIKCMTIARLIAEDIATNTRFDSLAINERTIASSVDSDFDPRCFGD